MISLPRLTPRLWLAVLLVAMAHGTVLAAAPDAPRNVSALVNGNAVALSWQAPASGSPPLGYLVEVALSPGGSVVAAFLVIDPAIAVVGVPNGVYYVRVRAGNAEGLSAPSNEVVVSVPGGGGPCQQAPNAPSGLTAGLSGSVVTLQWLAAVVGCPATAYVVHVGSTPGATDVAVLNVGAVTRLSVSAPPGTYFVRVVAVNAFGGSSPSNEVRVTVGAPDIDLTGVWQGVSDYINAPFVMTLRQRGASVSGTYQDQKDFGSVAAQVTGPDFVLDVNFGDTGIRFFATIESASRIRGTIWVPVLGRTFTFTMTR